MAKLVIGEGNIYQVDSTFTNGEYSILRFKDDAGKNEIACFLDDKCKGQNIAKGDMVKINRITRVTLGWKKKREYDKQIGAYVERWKQEMSLNIEATKTASDLDDAPDWIDEVEGGTLPWDDNLPI